MGRYTGQFPLLIPGDAGRGIVSVFFIGPTFGDLFLDRVSGSARHTLGSRKRVRAKSESRAAGATRIDKSAIGQRRDV